MKPANGKYKHLKRPDYFSPGVVLCKLCGDEIAGFVGEGRRRHYEQHGNYREIKIQCEDIVYDRRGNILRSNHVTNCCDRCLPLISENQEILQELLAADLDQMIIAVPALEAKLKDRVAKIVVERTQKAEALP